MDPQSHVLSGVNKLVVGCFKATLSPDQPVERTYISSEFGYKTADGVLTISQGNTVIEKQGSGFYYFDSITPNANITVAASGSNVISYVFRDAMGTSNAEVVSVTSQLQLPSKCYAVIVDGSFDITSSNSVVRVGNTQTQLSDNTMSVNAADFVSLTTFNDQTTIVGNGNIIILTKVTNA
jgi:hypothetical protein